MPFVNRTEFRFHSVEINFGVLPLPELSFAGEPWFGYHIVVTNLFGLALIGLNFAVNFVYLNLFDLRLFLEG